MTLMINRFNFDTKYTQTADSHIASKLYRFEFEYELKFRYQRNILENVHLLMQIELLG